jgi:hypothetical protein
MRPIQISPATIAAAIGACAREPVALNSERIQQRFGSYGIDVLSHKSGVRRSSLYSLKGATKICRTYAVVRFVDEATPSVAEAHADVLGGSSIGANFKSTDWQIAKISLYVGRVTLDDPEHAICQLMLLDRPIEVGVHAYQLVLEKDSQTIDYATIIETHHPDYLSPAELGEMYSGSIDVELSDEELDKFSTLIRDID